MTMDLRGHRRSIFLRVASMASRRDGAFADSPSRPLHAVDATHGLIPTQLYGRVADVARPHEVAVFYRQSAVRRCHFDAGTGLPPRYMGVAVVARRQR